MGKKGENWSKRPVFLGEYTHALDKEARVALPARLRDALGKTALDAGLCLTCGAEPCVVAYTHERLEHLLSALDADASLGRTAVRDFKRAFGATAAVVAPDAQGRIRLPEPLRAYARIERDVTIVGVVNAIELWSTPVYQGLAAARRAAYERLAPRVFG
ncbi:MAG: cell division/cell wall cluster transcriptional repressor MraZ [Planctomycetes bacterium]|nr:cell division/cell wall cluster transcriptional repressor MraZ [Planctomycetota bacterium]